MVADTTTTATADPTPAAGEPSDSDVQAAAPVPVVQVLSGSPEAEEIAALLAVFTAGGGQDPSQSSTTLSAWATPARRLRQGTTQPAGWRSSVLPG